MEVTIGGKGDGKVYTLVLKDDAASGPDDGYWLGEDIQSGNANGNQRREASLSWEAGFDITKGEKNGDGEKGDVLNVWLPWKDFKATYRGQPIEGAGGWKGGRVTRVGFMMRRQEPPTSFFRSYLSFRRFEKGARRGPWSYFNPNPRKVATS